MRVVDKAAGAGAGGEGEPDQEALYRGEARKLLEDIIDKNEEDKAISIVLEFAVGKVHETIQKMVRYTPP